jgi:tRNA threonylcarbamoyladenosine biosynthesis protein TsaB
MIVMGIETSCSSGSVAIIQGDHILGETLFNSGAKHSRNIISSIDNLIKLIDIDKRDIEGISVSIGPGSYTSLRIGITTAKTIAYALNIPIVGVPTLEVIAFNLNMCQLDICVIMDAKKNELFAALFKSDGNKICRISEDFIVSADNLCENIKQKTIIIGNGINLYKSIFEYRLRGLVLFAGEHLNIPRASNCALLGIGKLSCDDKVEINNISPLYLRKTDAELLI